MSESVVSLCYVAIAFCFVVKNKEFESVGLTVEHLFERFLGSESASFVNYHMRRTSITRVIHALLFPGYVVALSYFEGVAVFELKTLWWSAFVIFSFTLPTVVIFWMISWDFNSGKGHPFTKNLQAYLQNDQSWEDLAREINTEIMEGPKVTIKSSTISSVVATQHWIILLNPYEILAVHQNYAELSVKKANIYRRSSSGEPMVQYITINVTSTRPGVKPFNIRMNSVDFVEFQSKIRSNITVPPNVRLIKDPVEHFVDVFSSTAAQNPPYEMSQEGLNSIEKCIGCLQQQANVKLNKLCDGASNCTDCRCRPLWCVDCMAKWFASRQDRESPGTWLHSTCTCPVCRSVFCVLDVSFLQVQS